MNYWLICLPRADMEHCMKVGTFGLSRKNVISNVQKGDAVVCCAGKGDWKVVGTGHTTGDYYVDDKRTFLKDGYFPDRFDFQAKKLSKDAELDVMSLLDQLSFVKDLAYWAVFFRNGIVRLSKDDWNLITQNIDAPVRK